MLDIPPAAPAIALCVGLRLEYFTRAQAVSWADAQILKATPPSDTLIELALAQRESLGEVLALLRRLAPEAGTHVETELTFGLVHEMISQHRMRLAEATAAIAQLARTGVVTDREEGAAYHFEDGYELALNRAYGTLEDLEAELLEFTLPYWEKHGAWFGPADAR